MKVHLPESWGTSAEAVLHEYYRKPVVADSEEAEARIVHNFIANEFREQLFKVIGHVYVVALQRFVSVDPRTRTLTPKEFAAGLGVDTSTTWRWRTERTFAGADKFFAAQLLFLKPPLAATELPTDDGALKESVFAMYRHLSREYGPKWTTVLTTDVFQKVRDLMRVMTLRPDAVYNPFDPARTQSANDSALDLLANFIHEKRVAAEGQTISHRTRPTPTDMPHTLPSDVKSWLDSWGMPYALFTMSYRREWTPIGDIT